MNDRQLDQTIENISDATPSELGSVFVAVLRRLGEQGREGREAIIRAVDGGKDDDVEEGIAQLEDIITEIA
jgi:restriction endonuclease Mrr